MSKLLIFYKSCICLHIISAFWDSRFWR